MTKATWKRREETFYSDFDSSELYNGEEKFAVKCIRAETENETATNYSRKKNPKFLQRFDLHLEEI